MFGIPLIENACLGFAISLTELQVCQCYRFSLVNELGQQGSACSTFKKLLCCSVVNKKIVFVSELYFW